MRNLHQKIAYYRQEVKTATARAAAAGHGPERARLERHREAMQRILEKLLAKVEEKKRTRLERTESKGRTKALGRGKPTLTRTGPPRSQKPIPAVNATRRAKMRELQFSIKDGYHAFIVGKACIWCGRPGPGDPMHVRGVDLGGTAEHLLPACRLCHSWQETHKRQFEALFLEKHGITALEMARAMRAAYLLEKGYDEDPEAVV